MLNMIKMDFYRLFKTRCMYVIWIVMACFLMLSSYLTTMYLTTTGEDTQMEEGQVENVGAEAAQDEMGLEEENEPYNLGISVELPTDPEEKVTVYDEFYANTQAKVLALFIVIFAVLFSTADSSSGYIKNIGGQVKHRGGMIVSKALAILVYTVLTLGLALVCQAVCHRIALGYVKLGDARLLGGYFAAQVILHFALALICMAVAILLRNNVITMIFAVCLCMNFLMLLYEAIDKCLHNMGNKDFSIIPYTITGKIALLPMDMTQKEGISAFLVSMVFILIVTLFTCVIFEKRDIA